MVERVNYKDRPQVYYEDRIRGDRYVTVNFGITEEAEGYSCYSVSIKFDGTDPDVYSIAYKIDEMGLIQEIGPEEMSAIMDATGCTDRVSAAKTWMDLRIRRYDQSPAVNGFTLDGNSMWLDKATRSGLMLRLSAEAEAGKEYTVLWYGSSRISLSVKSAIAMLQRLELYASACYDKTQEHLSAMDFLYDPEKMLAYDYTEGYPEQPAFVSD